MNQLDKMIALKIQVRSVIYNFFDNSHICNVDRRAAFMEIRDEILEHLDYAHLIDQTTSIFLIYCSKKINFLHVL